MDYKKWLLDNYTFFEGIKEYETRIHKKKEYHNMLFEGASSTIYFYHFYLF